MKFQRVFFVLFAFFAFLPAFAAERPNILWIVSEDNSAEYLRLYNPQGAEMPQVEGLAERGVVFNHAFSNAPVCSVARSTLISGCYAPRVGGQYHRRMEKVPMPDDLKMFPAYLREAGYYCTNNSKEDYNLEPEGKVWDESSRDATYRDRKSGQPFFHVRNFTVTHESSGHFDPDKVDTSHFPDLKDSEIPPYLPDTKLSQLTRELYLRRNQELDQQIGQVLAQLEGDGLLEDTIIFYYGDHGGILPRSKGYVYESGLHVPLVVTVPDRWKHLFPAEKGDRVDGFVSFVDFAPTVLNLAGVDVPEQMDGVPFLGEGVSAEDLAARDTTFGYADRLDEKYDPVRTYRKGSLKYMRSYQPFNPDMGFNEYRYRMALYRQWRQLYDADELNPLSAQFFQAREPEALYDLENDPYELHNLASNPKYHDTLHEMRETLAEWVKDMPDLSFYPESVLIETAWNNPTHFGRRHAKEIAALVDTADLELIPFKEAEAKVKTALRSDNPWQRYWGLIVCSSFAEEAADLTDQIYLMAKSDPENLVRMRAAEFLGLTKADNPVPLLTEILEQASSPPEAVLILNTMAMLHDGPEAYKFPAAREAMGEEFEDVQGHLIRNRLDYLDPK